MSSGVAAMLQVMMITHKLLLKIEKRRRSEQQTAEAASSSLLQYGGKKAINSAFKVEGRSRLVIPRWGQVWALDDTSVSALAVGGTEPGSRGLLPLCTFLYVFARATAGKELEGRQRFVGR